MGLTWNFGHTFCTTWKRINSEPTPAVCVERGHFSMRLSALLFSGLVFMVAFRTGAQTAPAAAAIPSTLAATSDLDRSLTSTGGIEVLSDTRGVDFKAYLHQIHQITESQWEPLIPAEVNPPILLSGVVSVRFKILANGQLKDKSVTLDERSGHVSLDRAAWDAVTHAVYPPLPPEFKGPYLDLRLFFSYNLDKTKESNGSRQQTGALSAPKSGTTQNQ